MSDCDEYCANYGCNQGRNCPARKGTGNCTCHGSSDPQGFSQFERLIVWIAIVLSMYFCVAGMIRLLLG